MRHASACQYRVDFGDDKMMAGKNKEGRRRVRKLTTNELVFL